MTQPRIALFSSRKSRRILMALGVVLLLGAAYIAWNAGKESTDDAALDAQIVTLSPKVPGYVKTLFIADNQQVKAGDVLLQIDPADYLLRLNHAKAALEEARAAAHAGGLNFETTSISAPSNLDAAKAQMEAAEANWKKANNDLGRMQRLTDEARSREQLEAVIASEKTARSMLEDARAKYRSANTAPKTVAAAKANSMELQARIKQAEATVALAQKDLDDTKLVAPMDGRITKRGVERGDYVQPGQPLAFLVGMNLWVVANFKETQLEHMRVGQQADIEVDAVSSLKLMGKIESFQWGTGARFSSFPAENATGNFVKIVQRVPVKILLTSPVDRSLPLGAGLSVTATVHIK